MPAAVTRTRDRYDETNPRAVLTWVPRMPGSCSGAATGKNEWRHTGQGQSAQGHRVQQESGLAVSPQRRGPTSSHTTPGPPLRHTPRVRLLPTRRHRAQVSAGAIPTPEPWHRRPR